MRADPYDPIPKSGLKGFLLHSILGWTAAILFGAAGLFAARLFNLSNQPAAALTLGLFGLAGGVALARLLRSAGAKPRPSHVILLAATWALCSAGGAFALFFTMGTRLEMAIRTFYSFAVFGAAGGMITAMVLRSLFPQSARNDTLSGAVAWFFTFGLAAAAGDVAGEWLQLLLPSALAWPLAVAAMTVIMGLGSGCAILLFFKSDRGGWRALQTLKPTPLQAQKPPLLWVLIILCIPFYVNDLSNVFVKDWRWWLLIDYTGVKLYPLLVMLFFIRSRALALSDFIGPVRQTVVSFFTVVVFAVLTVLFLEQNGALLLKKLLHDAPLGGIPDIPDPLWKWIDLSAGLLMVGIFEEAVFRGCLHTVLRQYTRRPALFILASAASFGLIHWSGGLHQIILTAAVGAVFMLIYLRTYSLPALILSHFIVNFVYFARIIPSSLFSFFPVPPIR
ncbi:MAG: CPBP family intramembrane glutamic endopeptidase [Thermodesulfobacteriota bacterium]